MNLQSTQSKLQNVFMGVALDTYDEENGIHPRNKQLVSKRLAIAGLNVAYGMLEYPTNGPFPEVWNVIPLGNGLVQVDILYEKTFMWNPIETNGFSICCLETISDCNNRNGAWKKVHTRLGTNSECMGKTFQAATTNT